MAGPLLKSKPPVMPEDTRSKLLDAAGQKATFFCIAQNDDASWKMQHAGQPTIEERLKTAYADAGNPCGAEMFNAAHGWCMADSAVYNKAEAERAWTQMLATFKEGMA